MDQVEPIAIIGIGCRFPQADNPVAFWQLLRDGVDAITQVPAERWNVNDFYHEDVSMPGKTNTRWGGFLRELDQFDPDFFRLSPREARRMDPQQRILLEVAWEALEDAGQTLEHLSGTRTGIFVGVMNTDFARIYLDDLNRIDTYIGAGSASAIVANRVSYVFDFQGPSMVVDTLCSSSLVAIHLACQSLWNEESSPVALAGGVNIMLLPTMGVFYTKSGLTAPDGRCKSFDARANGIVRGEGAGIVVLKPLSKALADNDPIYCVIRGSAVNQDGRSNGLTAPSRWSQIAVLQEAYRRAGVSPGQVQYVETHGTGTPLGDPIEVAALGAVLATDRAPHNPCAIGSVKSNFGHLESAAGIASLIKTALALKHREIPSSLHFQKPNPYIPFEELSLRVQQKLGPWPTTGPALGLAGVSSFGLGGTNVHVVLEEAPPLGGGQSRSREARPEHADDKAKPAHLFTLSARSPQALYSLAGAYQQFLETNLENCAPSLHDLCYTQGERRTHHPFRLALVADSISGLSAQLGSFVSTSATRSAAASTSSLLSPLTPAFVFCGQGALSPQSGLQLLSDEPVFGSTFQRCSELFEHLSGGSLLSVLQTTDEQTLMERTDLAQPLLFALQVSLARLWKAWGVEPSVVIGHSVGEVAAAYIAGVLSLEDAVLVVFHRGRLMQRMSGRGKMAAVGLSVKEAEQVVSEYRDKEVVVSAHNGPRACVVSGLGWAVKEVVERLGARGVSTQWLKVNFGFHTPMMEEIRKELSEALREVKAEAGQIAIVSTMRKSSGNETAGGQQYDGRYWSEQIKERVEFAAAIKEVMRGGTEQYVEVGPQPVLRGSMTQCWEEVKREKEAERRVARREAEGEGVGGAGLLIVSSIERGDSGERERMLRSAGELWERGQRIEWKEVNGVEGRCVRLPGYVWQRQRFWIEERGSKNSSGFETEHLSRASQQGPFLGKGLKSAVHTQTYFWEVQLNTEAFSYLADHRVQNIVVLPASAYLEMALEAASEIFGASDTHRLEEVSFEHALLLPNDNSQSLQLVVSVEAEGRARFQFFSHNQATSGAGSQEIWTQHSQGMIRSDARERQTSAIEHDTPERIQRRCTEVLSGAKFYEATKQRGLQYGPGFQLVEQVWRQDEEALARLKSQEIQGAEAYKVHPALLDACFQSLTSALKQSNQNGVMPTYLPFGLSGLQIYASPSLGRWSHVLLRDEAQSHQDTDTDAELLTGDLFLLDENGDVLLEALGLQAKRVHQSLPRVGREDVGDWFRQIRWQLLERSPEVEAASSHSAKRRGGWLIFADNQGVGQSLARRLRESGHQCTLVYQAETYGLIEPEHRVIDPSSPDDMLRLFRDLFGADQPPCLGILHLWSIQAELPEQMSTARLEAAQAAECLSALHLVQALFQVGWKELPSLWLVTRGAQAVGQQTEAVSIAQSPLLGLGRTIFHEHPELHCRLVDLSGGDWPGDQSSEEELLFKEVSRPGDEREIAVRGEQLYAPGFERAISANALPPKESVSDVEFRPDASYLITGGLGGLGLVVAHWMVQRGARHLILLGRSKASDSAERAVAAMRELGCEVLTWQADVAHEDEVASVLMKIRESLPSLRGIIHAAGVVDDGIMLQLDQERFRRVMSPKVSGAWNLHQQSLDDPLDFFVLFSSLASMLGSAGQSNYAAANAFLDGLAHYRRGLGRPALSINWGPWAEVGMAAGHREGLSLKGFESITSREGMEVLERLLQGDLVQVGVLRPGAHTQARPVLGSSSRTVGEQDATGLPLFRQQMDAAAPEERWNLLLTHVRGEISRILGLDSTRRPELDRGLVDMGLDSLMAVELAQSLQTSTGHAFPIAMIFNHPTIESLSSYLFSELFSREAGAVLQAEAGQESEVDSVLNNLEQLSDDEALQLLTETLSR